jgi:hypothetical protein
MRVAVRIAAGITNMNAISRGGELSSSVSPKSTKRAM